LRISGKSRLNSTSLYVGEFAFSDATDVGVAADVVGRGGVVKEVVAIFVQNDNDKDHGENLQFRISYPEIGISNENRTTTIIAFITRYNAGLEIIGNLRSRKRVLDVIIIWYVLHGDKNI
jgi:stage V sporulation protein SpoVS